MIDSSRHCVQKILRYTIISLFLFKLINVSVTERSDLRTVTVIVFFFFFLNNDIRVHDFNVAVSCGRLKSNPAEFYTETFRLKVLPWSYPYFFAR